MVPRLFQFVPEVRMGDGGKGLGTLGEGPAPELGDALFGCDTVNIIARHAGDGALLKLRDDAGVAGRLALYR